MNKYEKAMCIVGSVSALHVGMRVCMHINPSDRYCMDCARWLWVRLFPADTNLRYFEREPDYVYAINVGRESAFRYRRTENTVTVCGH
jgi:hypothetical protein